jgi:hypothetical protein
MVFALAPFNWGLHTPKTAIGKNNKHYQVAAHQHFPFKNAEFTKLNTNNLDKHINYQSGHYEVSSYTYVTRNILLNI